MQQNDRVAWYNFKLIRVEQGDQMFLRKIAK
jgi:hypothetical protein